MTLFGLGCFTRPERNTERGSKTDLLLNKVRGRFTRQDETFDDNGPFFGHRPFPRRSSHGGCKLFVGRPLLDAPLPVLAPTGVVRRISTVGVSEVRDGEDGVTVERDMVFTDTTVPREVPLILGSLAPTFPFCPLL